MLEAIALEDAELGEGGFSVDRVLVEDLRPVPAVCVKGRPQGG